MTINLQWLFGNTVNKNPVSHKDKSATGQEISGCYCVVVMVMLLTVFYSLTKAILLKPASLALANT